MFKIAYLRRAEDLWQQEVKQSPEFMKVILQRCASQEEAISGTELSHNFRKFTLFILDTVSLINHHVSESKS